MSKEFSSFFTRPPRQTYYEHDLGPQIFPIDTKSKDECRTGERTNFIVLNNLGLKINCSFYHQKKNVSDKCLIYLHTHHGSKIEAIFLVEPMLKDNVNVCLFDFTGYGNSEGDSVTLGIRESNEIGKVVEELREKFHQKNFVLWGRSMGAVASLLYLSKNERKSKNQGIVGGIFDSPFYSIYELSLEIGSKNLGFPQPIIRPFLYLLKKSLQDDINFDELEILELVKNIKIGGYFLASKNDKFVSCKHSEELYNNYGGIKELLYIDEDHNEPRKKEELKNVFNFIFDKMNVLKKRESKCKLLSIDLNRLRSGNEEKLTESDDRNSERTAFNSEQVITLLTERSCLHKKKMSIISLNTSPIKKVKAKKRNLSKISCVKAIV